MKTEFRVRPIRIFPSLKNAQNRGPRVMDSRPQNRRSSEFFAVFAFFSCFLIKKIFFCVILRKNFTSTFFRWWLSDKMKNSTRVSISTDRSSGGGKDFAIFGAQNWKSGRRSCSYSWKLKRSRRPSGRRSIKFYEKLMILKKGNASILKDLGALQFKRPRCRGPWGKNYQNPLIS